jgi:hypothetical protein
MTNHDFGKWQKKFILDVAGKCAHQGDARFLRNRVIALAEEWREHFKAVIQLFRKHPTAGPDIAHLIMTFVVRVHS